MSENPRVLSLARTIFGAEASTLTAARAQSAIVYQSSTLPVTGKGAFSSIKSETVVFEDESSGHTLNLNTHMDSSRFSDGINTSTDLEAFFSRPVRVSSFTWNEADPIGTHHKINVWQALFSDDRMKYKLNNYAFLQCELEVKVIINASPFYYGAMLVNYTPLTSFDAASSIHEDAGGKWFIPYSQRPHCWIYPQKNEGCEMTLPFLYNKNWLTINRIADFSNMGTLDLVNYTSLQSANGVTGSGVTVQVYAWAKNVRLSGPTLGLALTQSKDEYVGGVSGPASNVAKVASTLKQVPMIGHLAKATELAAAGVAAGAKTLGYSNTPVQEDIKSYQPQAIPDFSTSEIGCQQKKLTLDPRNELSIDPAIVGLGAVDETSVTYLAQKESYLCTTTMSTTHSVDDALFTCAITPTVSDLFTGVGQTVVQQTPMCWLAQLFKAWRGDIIFRFKFVLSPYHKGRVRISFDPSGYIGTNIVNTTTSSNAVYTEIVDFGKQDSVEMRIPFSQARAWLRTVNIGVANVWSTSLTPSFDYNEDYFNGTLVMRVLTNLTAPVLSSSIPIMVFVRGAETLEFANPQFSLSDNRKWSYFSVQSADELVVEEEVVDLPVPSVNPSPSIHLVYYGEAIGNLKQLLRRTVLSGVLFNSSTGSTAHNLYIVNSPKMPPVPGFDPGGMNAAFGIAVTGPSFSYSVCKFTPLSYVTAAFVGMRGSIVWHITGIRSDSGFGLLRVSRIQDQTVTLTDVVQSTSSTNRGIQMDFYMQNANSGSGGSAATVGTVQPNLSVTVPNMSSYLFQNTGPKQGTAPSSIDGSAFEGYKIENWFSSAVAPLANHKLIRHVAVGSDWNVHFFLNVPTLFYYDSIPIVTS